MRTQDTASRYATFDNWKKRERQMDLHGFIIQKLPRVWLLNVNIIKYNENFVQWAKRRYLYALRIVGRSCVLPTVPTLACDLTHLLLFLVFGLHLLFFLFFVHLEKRGKSLEKITLACLFIFAWNVNHR